MHHSKLILLLQSLDKSEIRAFSDFAGSSYFNKNEALVRFFDLLKPFGDQAFRHSDLTREAIWGRFCPDRSYDEKELNYLMSQLTKLLERFLGQRQFEQDGVQQEIYQLEAHLERGLDKGYRFLARQTSARLRDQADRTASALRQAFDLARLEEIAFSNQGIRKSNPSLQAASDRFDEYFLSKKLTYLCALLDYRKQFPGQYNIAMLPEIRSALQSGEYDHNPQIAIHGRLLEMQIDPGNTRLFFEFRQLLSEFKNRLVQKDATDLYLHGINYCIQQVRHGQAAFAETLLSLYEEALQEGFLLQDGHISPWTYKNVVKLGLGLNQFDRVEQFIVEYTDLLPENQKTDAFQFNMADLHYHRKDYDQALDHLKNVEFTDIHYKLDARVILCKVYFETGESEALLSLLSAFRIFLMRSGNISRQVKEPYLNFISILGKLQRGNQAHPEKLEVRIRKTAMLSNRNWLLRQIKLANPKMG